MVEPATSTEPAPGPGRVLTVVCALIPFLVVAWYALHSTLNYDGALNLQVAENIADGHGFVREYGGVVASPQEVETSGLYLALAAAAIKVFGSGLLVLQLTNLLFVAVLFGVVMWALRPWPWVALVGPTFLVLTVPHTAELALGGFGEFVVAALFLAACVLIGHVAAGADRPLRRLVVAFVLVGLAITVKSVALGMVPVVLIGLVLAALARPELPRLKAAGTAALLLVPVAMFELYRLSELGSFAAWRGYWDAQLSSGRWLSGSSPRDTAGILPRGEPAQHAGVVHHDGGVLDKAYQHVQALASATGTELVPLVLLLALPFVLTLAAFLMRGGPWRTWLARPGRVLLVMLAALGALYLVWWLFVTPDERTWLRRVVIGWVAIDVMYLLLAGMGITWLRAHWSPELWARWGLRAVGVGLVLLVGATVVATLQIASFNTQAYADPPDEFKTAEETASRSVAHLAQRGAHVYGLAWGSAPVVAVTSHVPLGDLAAIHPCAPTVRAQIEAGKAYLVWDLNAMTTESRRPVHPWYTFTLVDSPSGYANVWRVGLRRGVCPPKP